MNRVVTGRRTCASLSALSLDAQPAQFERLVRRICLPDGWTACNVAPYGWMLGKSSGVLLGRYMTLTLGASFWMYS